jgi:hypothetical protein
MLLLFLSGYVSDPQLATHNLHLAATQTGRAKFMFNKNVVEILKDKDQVSVPHFFPSICAWFFSFATCAKYIYIFLGDRSEIRRWNDH